jgi:ribosomal protein L35AE/L33A
MVCCECGKESAGEFKFCPHCGKAFTTNLQEIKSPGPSMQGKSVPEVAGKESSEMEHIPPYRLVNIGTYVFGAFSAISILTSIARGIVPIYLVEAAIWAGCAWYWHRKRSHSELAKAIIIVLAVLIAIGEVVSIAKQFTSEPKQAAIDAKQPLPKIPEYASTPLPADNSPTVARDGVKETNGDEAHVKSEPTLGKETYGGLQATVTCDVIAYDRDKYGDGDPRAIGNLHQGDTVLYVGHVTVGDQDIIRVHGRKGYVDGCVDVNLSQDLSGKALKESESKVGKETSDSVEATMTCDAIVWDRDEYGEGDPLAIATVHRGDTVPYVGHVTVGDQDIIRVHGRRGYVRECVEVKQ